MAKTTRHGGPSDEAIKILQSRPRLGGSPSVGKSSTQSTKKHPQSGASGTPDPQAPVPTTENPSNQTDTETSSVDSTDGVTPETHKRQSAKKTTKKATTRSVAFDDFEDFQ